jgi:HEAT repeat protein
MIKVSIQILLKNRDFDSISKFRKDKKAIKAIINLTKEQNPLKHEAILALGFIGEKESIKQLYHLSQSSPDEQELGSIINAIKEAGIPAQEYMLEKALLSKAKEQEKTMLLLEQVGKKHLEVTLRDIAIVDPLRAYMYEIMITVYLGKLEESVYRKKFDYHQASYDKMIKSIITTAFDSETEAYQNNAINLVRKPIINKLVAPVILKTLKNDSKSSIHFKLIKLINEKSKTKDIEDFLIRGLSSDNRENRMEIIKALGRIKSVKAISKLIKVLKEEDQDITYEAATSLSKIGESAAQPLIDSLKKFTDLENIHLALKRLGEPAVDYLADAMGSKDKKIRENASKICIIILSQKYGYAGTITRLVDLLADKAESVQEAVIDSIIDMGEPAIPHVIRYVPNSRKGSRENALDIIEHFGETMVELTLKRALQNGKANEAAILGTILYVYLDEANGEEVPHVIQKIALDTLFKVKQEINRVRTDVGKRISKNATEVLKIAMKEKEEFIRKNAAWLTRIFSSNKLIEESIRKEKNQEIKMISIESIGEMGKNAKDSAGFLVSLLSDRDVNIHVVRSLGKLGDIDVINKISERIRKDKSENFKKEALKVIEQLKSGEKE